MDDVSQDVTAEETATDSSAETNEEVVESQEETTAEPVDESGVPLRNRQAEQERKARRLSQAEAQSRLVSGTETSNEMTQDEAVKAVEDIADTRVRKAMEPLLAKQFLLEHPDAAEMIEDINRIRSQKSHLKGVEHLEDVYKIVKADRQDEMIRQQVENELRDKQVRTQAASQSSAEGVGKTKSASKVDDLATRIANAKTMEELQALGASLSA